MIIHELAHIIMAGLMFLKINHVKIVYFYDVISEDPIQIAAYRVEVQTLYPNTKMGHIRSMMVDMAPLIPILVLPFVNYWFLPWLSFSIGTFWPSEQDWSNVKSSLKYLRHGC